MNFEPHAKDTKDAKQSCPYSPDNHSSDLKFQPAFLNVWQQELGQRNDCQGNGLSFTA